MRVRRALANSGLMSAPILKVLALLASASALSGCSGSAPHAALVTGTLEAVGGPGGLAPRPLNGTITLRGVDGLRFTGTAGAEGTFSVAAQAGSYTITGRSPLYQSGLADCEAPTPVTLRADTTTVVTVACSER